MVAVNSVSLDSVEDSINGTIEKTVAAYDVTKQVVTDLSEKASPAVSALAKFVEAYAPVVKKGTTKEDDNRFLVDFLNRADLVVLS